MKSAMPYLGVRVPDVRRIVRAAAKATQPTSVVEVEAAAAALWRGAEYREERYAATATTGLPVATGALALLPLYEEFIVTGAWWDHVDDVAHRIGDLLEAHPAELTPVLRGWAVSSDRWLRRVSIIAQLGVRRRVDPELLTYAIEESIGESDFFVRKAIGWALRDYARVSPAWVRSFVDAHPDLSPLSRREALRHLG